MTVCWCCWISGRDSNHQRLGGSALAQVYRQLGNQAPDVEEPEQFKALLDLVLSWKRQGKILAMHDRSDGGAGNAIRNVLRGSIGHYVEVPYNDDVLAALFNEEIGFALQIAAGDLGVTEGGSAGQLYGDRAHQKDDRVVIQSQRR